VTINGHSGVKHFCKVLQFRLGEHLAPSGPAGHPDPSRRVPRATGDGAAGANAARRRFPLKLTLW